MSYYFGSEQTFEQRGVDHATRPFTYRDTPFVSEPFSPHSSLGDDRLLHIVSHLFYSLNLNLPVHKSKV